MHKAEVHAKKSSVVVTSDGDLQVTGNPITAPTVDPSERRQGRKQVRYSAPSRSQDDDPGGLSPGAGLSPPNGDSDSRRSSGSGGLGGCLRRSGQMQRQLSRTSSCDKVKILHDSEQTEPHDTPNHYKHKHRKRLVKIRFKKPHQQSQR